MAWIAEKLMLNNYIGNINVGLCFFVVMRIVGITFFYVQTFIL